MIVGLIAVSTVHFVIGVTVERRGEAAEGAGAHQELSSEPEASEGGEAGESGEEEGVYQEEASSHEVVGEAGEYQEESILGIIPDATGVVATVVIGWMVLAAGLLLFGPRVLILVVLAVLVLRQQSRGGPRTTPSP